MFKVRAKNGIKYKWQVEEIIDKVLETFFAWLHFLELTFSLFSAYHTADDPFCLPNGFDYFHFYSRPSYLP